MMPDFSGMDFHAEFSSKRPALLPNVIFMTGGAFTPRAREFIDRVSNARIEKPFRLNALLTLIEAKKPG